LIVEEELAKQNLKEELKSCKGCDIKTPVKNCHQLKIIRPSVKSGYYWIKPLCVGNPVRAYCHFEF
jgi:hypothetical protein